MFGSVLLQRLNPDFAAMVPSTALSFLLAASAILVQARSEPSRLAMRWTRLVAIMLLVVSVIDILVIAGTDANGIDMLLWPDAGVFESASMAIATATNFALAGICLWRLDRPAGAADGVFAGAATLGLVLSGIAITGYVFDTQALYEISLFTAMALHTALAFAAVFTALLLVRPRASWVGLLAGSGGGSRSVRRMFPGVIIVPFILCLVALEATHRGLVNANFRLSVLAIIMMVLMSAAVLYYANIQNRIERRLRAALADRELLLREVYHRVKNNLQMTTALLRLGLAETKDPAAQAIINGTIKRVESIGVVHRLLMSARVPSELTADKFLHELCENVLSGSDLDPAINLEIHASDDRLHVETAVTLGLLVNELLTNAAKHAFPEGGPGTISVSFHRDNSGDGLLVVRDTGIGYNPESSPRSGGIGTTLVTGLVSQLDGEMYVSDDNGTQVTVMIPVETFEERDYVG